VRWSIILLENEFPNFLQILINKVNNILAIWQISNCYPFFVPDNFGAYRKSVNKNSQLRIIMKDKYQFCVPQKLIPWAGNCWVSHILK
jgi:hypothetical protein